MHSRCCVPVCCVQRASRIQGASGDCLMRDAVEGEGDAIDRAAEEIVRHLLRDETEATKSTEAAKSGTRLVALNSVLYRYSLRTAQQDRIEDTLLASHWQRWSTGITGPGTLRGLAWLLSLQVLGPISLTWPDQLQRVRTRYRQQCLQRLDATGRRIRVDGDPLTDPHYRAHDVMARDIDLDVQRMFPAEPSGADAHGALRAAVRRLLLGHVAVHHDYCQGMQEVLLPLLAAFAGPIEDDRHDAAATPEQQLAHRLARLTAEEMEVVEANAFAAFERLIARTAPIWQPDRVDRQRRRSDPPWIRQHRALLHATDQPLYLHLFERVGVHAEHYLIRWMRTLFVQDVPLWRILPVWDALLLGRADEYGYADAAAQLLPALMDYSVAVLVHMRESLLATDHASDAILLLQHVHRHFPPTIWLQALEEYDTLQRRRLGVNGQPP